MWDNPVWKVEPITDALLNQRIRDNENALKTPASSATVLNSSAVFNSSTFASIVTVSSFTSYGGDILVVHQNRITINSGTAYFDVALDGSRQGGPDGITAITSTGANTIIWLLENVLAGEHSIAIQAKTTGSFNRVAVGQMLVREVS
jgi:hypothetical protein